jgi:hypothetical protein
MSQMLGKLKAKLNGHAELATRSWPSNATKLPVAALLQR